MGEGYQACMGGSPASACSAVASPRLDPPQPLVGSRTIPRNHGYGYPLRRAEDGYGKQACLVHPYMLGTPHGYGIRAAVRLGGTAQWAGFVSETATMVKPWPYFAEEAVPGLQQREVQQHPDQREACGQRQTRLEGGEGGGDGEVRQHPDQRKACGQRQTRFGQTISLKAAILYFIFIFIFYK